MELVGQVFGFHGRIGRVAFWLMTLPSLAILIIVQLALSPLTSTEPSGFTLFAYAIVLKTISGLAEGSPPLVPTLFVIVSFLLFLSASVRRLHDLGQSGLLVLVIFWPIIFLSLRYALSIFGIEITRYLLAPAQYPMILQGFILTGTILGIWQIVLLFQMAFRRGLYLPEDSPVCRPPVVLPD